MFCENIRFNCSRPEEGSCGDGGRGPEVECRYATRPTQGIARVVDFPSTNRTVLELSITVYITTHPFHSLLPPNTPCFFVFIHNIFIS